MENSGLKERDFEMLKVIGQEQFLSKRLMAKYFFCGSFNAASNRVFKLVARGVLRCEKLVLPGSPKVIRLAMQGQRLFRECSPFQVKQKRRVPLSTFSHDEKVSELRLKLRAFFDASWIPEKAMKTHTLKRIPDGILLFQSAKRIAVELENSIKAKTRYEQMWREWEGHDFVLVLYVATTDAVYRTLEKRMNEFQTSKVRFGLIRFRDVISGTTETTVWTPRGAVPLFSRREF